MRYDAVIVGAGHNGLTSAAYLARAGRSVLVLERAEVIGGGARSAQVFPACDAQFSAYSYLVSLMPQQIIDELGQNLQLHRRRISSYTPASSDGIRSTAATRLGRPTTSGRTRRPGTTSTD